MTGECLCNSMQLFGYRYSGVVRNLLLIQPIPQIFLRCYLQQRSIAIDRKIKELKNGFAALPVFSS